MDWTKKKVLVTGGASFIGSHLVDRLVELGVPYIRIVDDLSSGKLENLNNHRLYSFDPSVDLQTCEPRFAVNEGIAFWEADLLDQKVSKKSVEGIDIVFHLAANHGGRGVVDLHQVGPSTNLILSSMLFKSAYEAGVEKIAFASSGCVYPDYLQQDIKEQLYLKEGDAGPPYEPDNMYGWEKLTSEQVLQAYYDELGIKSVSLRYFTVYGGKRMKPDHALCAMTYRAYAGQDPFEVWGTGEQIRNWTRVEDIVEGTILGAENIDDATAINLGTEERITVGYAAEKILDLVGRGNATIKYLPNKPTGPLNRVCDNSRAEELLNWKPRWSFNEGLGDMVEEFMKHNDPQKLRVEMSEKLFIER